MISRVSVAAILVALFATFSSAQTVGLPTPNFESGVPFEGAIPQDGSVPLGGNGPGLGNLAVPAVDVGGNENIFVLAEYQLHEASVTGLIQVTVDVQPPYYTYGIAQNKSGKPTKISVDGVQLTGSFEAEVRPDVTATFILEDEAPELLEKHKGTTRFVAPFKLYNGQNGPPQITIHLDGQICNVKKDKNGFVGCIPIEITKKALPSEDPLAEEVRTPLPAYSGLRIDQSRTRLDGFMAPGTILAGRTAYLSLQTISDPGWYVYAMEEKGNSLPVRIVFDDLPKGFSVGEIQPQYDAQEKKPFENQPAILAHSGAMSWVVPIQADKDLQPGNYTISGTLGYQTCTTGLCQSPQGAKFTASVTIGSERELEATPVTFEVGKYPFPTKEQLAAAEGVDVDTLNVPRQGSSYGLLSMLLIAFAGGFILNFMPCVLPVIGLKAMSFANQAGEARSRVFMLNAYYTLGLLFVFMCLATIAAAVSLGLSTAKTEFGWGQQFNNDVFNVIVAAVVFVMGLSFLGIWEIPIPGFASGNKANELAEKEGGVGAFFKGIMATLLATPCSGPMLAPALTWSAGQPILYIYLIFAFMGLGMALPYVVLGLSPAMVRFLPKPGPWMETFKQLMGFILLATVIFFLSFLGWELIVPTVGFLFGLWFACWWIGKISYDDSMAKTVSTWFQAGIVAAAIGFLCFGSGMGIGGYEINSLAEMQHHRYLDAIDRKIAKLAPDAELPERPRGKNELPWQPFTEERFAALSKTNKTIMIDFTADWCLSCKFLEKTVLNTEAVKKTVTENNVVTLVADWNGEDPAVEELLAKLSGRKQVPVLAIFPAGDPQNPIVFADGTYGQESLIKALEEAGPSGNVASSPSTESERISEIADDSNKLSSDVRR
jgi:suppressor for copper-sensitivity B